MAGPRGAASKKKSARRPGSGEGAQGERPPAAGGSRPAAAAGKPAEAEGEKRPARKPARPATPSAPSGGFRQRIDDFGKFLKSVRAEMKRVTWPSGAEVRAATIVVVLTLVIISAYMGLVDWLLSFVFGHKFTGFN